MQNQVGLSLFKVIAYFDIQGHSRIWYCRNTFGATYIPVAAYLVQLGIPNGLEALYEEFKHYVGFDFPPKVNVTLGFFYSYRSFSGKVCIMEVLTQ